MLSSIIGGEHGTRNIKRNTTLRLNTCMNVNYDWKVLSDKELQQTKSRSKIPVRCSYCGTIKMRVKKHVLDNIRNKGIKYPCCSSKCGTLLRDTRITISCKQCGTPIFRRQSDLKKYKEVFCTRSCNRTYHNVHKRHGYRRSKIEKFICKHLQKNFKHLEIRKNDRQTIGLELDIFIPALRMAFEINGIFHYEPIFSKTKLQKIQYTDQQKLIQCANNDIELVIINISQVRNFKEQRALQYYQIVHDLVAQNIARADSVYTGPTT